MRPNLSKSYDISLPVRFDPSFRAFGAQPANSKSYQAGDFTLSVAEGAGCNCEVFTFSAHLHGTHTECVGHITKEQHIVQDLISDELFTPCQLVSITPEPAPNTSDTYQPKKEASDLIITKASLERACPSLQGEALVIRTLPNGEDKKTRNYDEALPPYFSNEAMVYICDLGVNLLLVDLPSVDRLEDEGVLSNHHIYWGLEIGSTTTDNPSKKSITEFIYVPNEVPDGPYLLNLNVGNIRSDAAPSKPTLFEILKSDTPL